MTPSFSEICHCNTTEQTLAACTLLDHMYPEHDLAYIQQIVQQMQQEGWQQIGIFLETGQCVATIMYQFGHRLFCGKYMQIESLFVDPEYRRDKLGQQLFDWLDNHARSNGCQRILLQSYVENFPGHKFFYKQGYFIRGYVINKLLD